MQVVQRWRPHLAAALLGGFARTLGRRLGALCMQVSARRRTTEMALWQLAGAINTKVKHGLMAAPEQLWAALLH